MKGKEEKMIFRSLVWVTDGGIIDTETLRGGMDSREVHAFSLGQFELGAQWVFQKEASIFAPWLQPHGCAVFSTVCASLLGSGPLYMLFLPQ